MIIKQPPHELPTVAVKTLLKLRMRQASRVRPVQKANQRLELLTARSKPSPSSAPTRRADADARSSRCSIATTPLAGQDFITRRVMFATTGVEIGGHAGHLRGRYVEFHVTTSTSRDRLC